MELLDKGIVKLVCDYCEKEINTKYGKFFVVMSHYPILEFNGAYHKNSIMLYGHTHGTDKGLYNEIYKQLGFNTYHVGVDTNDFTPITLEEIIEKKVKEL